MQAIVTIILLVGVIKILKGDSGQVDKEDVENKGKFRKNSRLSS